MKKVPMDNDANNILKKLSTACRVFFDNYQLALDIVNDHINGDISHDKWVVLDSKVLPEGLCRFRYEITLSRESVKDIGGSWTYRSELFSDEMICDNSLRLMIKTIGS